MKHLVVLLTSFVILSRIEESVAEAPPLKSETFDRDPDWEAHKNHIVPKEYPTITQGFGYSSTGFAGKTPDRMPGNWTISGTSNNTNSVSTLGQTADSNYNQSQMQDVLNKLDEFLNAARR